MCSQQSGKERKAIANWYIPGSRARPQSRVLAFLVCCLETHLIQAHGVFKPLEIGRAAVAEIESLTRGELSHHVRDEDIASIGLGADAGGELERAAEQVVILRHRLAGV